MITMTASTIAALEAYTFTDLPQLESLMLEYGLRQELKQLQDGDSSEEIMPAILTQADFVVVRRLHCDCSFAWFRNFLKRKPHLTSAKRRGAVATIGSYKTSVILNYADMPSVLSVDCSRDLTFDNIQAGTQFSYNTSCNNSPQCSVA
ncbi:uncharacterized protein LOC129591124 [Paramacrobiotus metropolitanus]|uniref:uncharacterized protein LOC129591124 n=1 Tax=Paramacrobiotus metropolitanus TaxID=2943436 RepID=UPI0024457BBA|nr:uncharacterized protein LOC129591124 [Paramacrobiotus metropolitanus]